MFHQPREATAERAGLAWLVAFVFARAMTSPLKVSGSLGNFKIPERNGAFGPVARAGEGVADQRTEQKAQWSAGF